jgi:deoxyribodipyrimidine photo-lyase
MNLVWFRNDLRLADHPALTQALKSGKPTRALYVLTPQQHRLHGEAPQKLEFIKAHVNNLSERLAKIGVRLSVREVPLYADVPACVAEVCEQHDVSDVYLHQAYWVNEVKRDQQVAEALASRGINWHASDSEYLLPPGTVRKDDGGMYHVFTPYKNKFIEHLKQAHQSPLPVPDADDSRACNAEPPLAVDFQLPDWPIGEQAIHQRLKTFLNEHDYQQERDYPATDGTSCLSPYLAIGVINARLCLAHALKQSGEEAFHSTWVSELIWRDFYNDLMFEYPRLAKHQTFKPEAPQDWPGTQDLFEAWQAGQTGFPIIDAGMRQLQNTGWMHNRVRMLTASFLSKLCLVDWHLGEAHFMAHLLDGDLASNNGGWQWSSATGCDAAPYFRIFNPTSQSEKFDKQGDYIRAFVPELADLEGKAIHNPSAEQRRTCGYPDPVIDYKTARSQALDWFKSQ